MRAKLIKSTVQYRLLNEDGIVIATSFYNGKLSLKNCQAIERGYDLDDCVDYFEKGKLYIQQDGVIILAGENGNNGIIIQDPLETRGVGHYSDEWNPKAFCEFKQKALEILGDKKFSEEDVKKAYMTGWNSCSNFNGYDENQEFIELPDCIQSLQQTEWDVEICTYVDTQGYDIPNADSFSHGNIFTNTGIPKLDADGCLILKRI